MTKQVFEQIAEGLREAAETPPAWAMEKARGIVAKRFAADSKTVAIALSGAMDQHEPDILDIARAIAEADKAATERERERVEINIDALKAVFSGKGPFALGAQKALEQLAAAIRGAGQ